MRNSRVQLTRVPLFLVLSHLAAMATAQRITLIHDSLEARLTNARTDAERVALHDQLAMVYIDQLDDRKALAHLEEGLAIAQRTKNEQGLAYAPLLNGMEQLIAHDHASAIRAFKTCIDRLDKLGVKQGLLSPLGLIRQLYNTAGSQDERFEFYTVKLAYYKAHGPQENLGACYHGLGGYYFASGQADKAIENYLRAREVFSRFDPVGYANQPWPISAMYLSWGNPQKAEEYQRLAIEENLKVGLLTNVMASYGGMSDVQLAKGDTTSALQALGPVARIGAAARRSCSHQGC
ncbi:MAG: tetratricopeptide repeat protein [Flavobacteriales bacterium]|nr:tetratricopeptide repeat protein [Flavobacteriales bacterium]